MNPTIHQLSQLTAFAGLEPETLTTLAEAAVVANARSGIRLLQEGDSLTHLVGILSGALRFTQRGHDGTEQTVGTLEEGETIGWISVLDAGPSNVSAWSEGDSVLLLIPAQTAREIIMRSKALTEFAFKYLTRTIRHQESTRKTLALPNAYQRVYSHILGLLQTHPDRKLPLVLPKQSDIASHVNVSRETVSRALQLLVKNGALVKEGHRVRMIQINQLQKMAEQPQTDVKKERPKSVGSPKGLIHDAA